VKWTLLLAAVLAGSEAVAQESGAPPEIVVEAQRSGAPIWTIDTPRGTILLVGEILEVPESTPWHPDRQWGPRHRHFAMDPRNRARFFRRIAGHALALPVFLPAR